MKFAQYMACGVALIASGCSSTAGGLPAMDGAQTSVRTQQSQTSSPSLATYEFFCSQIGLGTITAIVVANSRGDAFHVTNVVGGNRTVMPGDMLLVVAFSPPNVGRPNTTPGFDKNGQTTYTCPSFSGRRQLLGTATFFVRGGNSG